MKNFRCIPILLGLFLLAQSTFAGTLIQFHMFLGVNLYAGDIDVELYDKDKPITVNNFIRLIEAGAFQNGFFHRVETGFVLQGGSYQTILPYLTNVVAPPFGNIYQTSSFGPITNEFKVGKFYSNTNGTIAMSKTSDPNSATSGFFFNLGNNSTSLDNTNNSGGFTVFGHVLRDTNGILPFISTFHYGQGEFDLTKNYGANGFFTELPAYIAGTNPPPYSALIYYTVTILSPQVKALTNGSHQISWGAIDAVTNRVEYSTNLLTWQTLTNIVGHTPNPNVPFTNIVDSATNNRSRFYRVHVLY